MQNNKLIIIVVFLLLLVGGYFLISNNKEATNNVDTTTTNEPVKDEVEESEATVDNEESVVEDEVTNEVIDEDASMTEEATVKTFEVGGGGFYFNPNEITVTEGDTVKIVFTNEGGTHNWVVDEFGASTPIIQTGETAEVEFVADKAGTFEYYCSVGNHRELGMVGTLTVQPKQ